MRWLATDPSGSGFPERHEGHDHLTTQVMRKLPHVNLLFWILKTLAVTLGETAGDLLGITLQVGYAATSAIFLLFFLVVVSGQVRASRFHPVLFWAVVLGTSMVGTEISDLSNRGFGHGSAQNGIGYAWGAIILTSLLAVVFLVWWRTGQTYDVENIASRKGEILYWIAILVSNTLGTSSGDWLSDDTGLGFRNAFFLIAAIMLVIVAAHYLTNINTTVLFWLAFVLTRPLGAAGGDALTKPADEGGLGWGTLGGSAALFTLLAGFTVFQIVQIRRHPLPPLPFPVSRRTGQPQRPNGQIVGVAVAPAPADRRSETEPSAVAHDKRPAAAATTGRWPTSRSVLLLSGIAAIGMSGAVVAAMHTGAESASVESPGTSNGSSPQAPDAGATPGPDQAPSNPAPTDPGNPAIPGAAGPVVSPAPPAAGPPSEAVPAAPPAGTPHRLEVRSASENLASGHATTASTAPGQSPASHPSTQHSDRGSHRNQVPRADSGPLGGLLGGLLGD